MAFEFSALVNGPEHRASWTADVERRITTMLSVEPTGPGTVHLHLHVGGSLGDPAWAGPGKASRRKAVVYFDVGIPLAIQDVGLEERLLAFAEASVDAATEACHRAGFDFDEGGHRQVIESTRTALADLQPPAARREDFRAFEERFARRKSMREAKPEVYPEPRSGPPMPRLRFRWSSQADLDRLFELEVEVDRRLPQSSLGEVDGNEVGGDSYDLFVTPRPGQKRRAMELAEKVVADAGLAHFLTTTRRRGTK